MKQYNDAQIDLGHLLWLGDRAIAQAARIDEYVLLTGIKNARLSLDKKHLVSLTLEITNGSVFDIAILPDRIGGHLLFTTNLWKLT